jgi:hypothetical protein
MEFTKHARHISGAYLQYASNKISLNCTTIPNVTNSVVPEPEGSSPHSQEHANCLYSEPSQSNPHPLVRGSSLRFLTDEGFSTAQTQIWRTTPCCLSKTACSIYSQLHSISPDRLLHPQPEHALCRGDLKWSQK